MNHSVKKSKNFAFSKGIVDLLEEKEKPAAQRENLRSIDMTPRSFIQMGNNNKEKEDHGDIFKRNPEQKYDMKDLLESKEFKNNFSSEERKKILEVCSKNSPQARELNRKFTSISSNNFDDFQFDLGKKFKTMKSDNNIITEF